ncbi:MAG: TM0106 family RecB-like putative nuclease [Cyanobacteriota bacterium]|jgi:predicted RecB family nuclease
MATALPVMDFSPLSTPGRQQVVTDLLLLDYRRCSRRAYLNLFGDEREREPERDFLLKLRQESQRHIQTVLQRDYPHYRQPQALREDYQVQTEETLALMAQGTEVIYGGRLSQAFGEVAATGEKILLVGAPALLVKQAGHSRWGDWQYRPLSIHLGRRPKPEYKILAAFYAHLLGHNQGQTPGGADLILRQGHRFRVDLREWLPRFYDALSDYLTTLCEQREPEVFISRQRCHLCHWQSHCYGLAQSQKHLSLVPGVTPSRYEALQTLGIQTLFQLADSAASPLENLLGPALAQQLQCQALALVENRPFRRQNTRSFPLPQAPVELYFDIEAEPEQNLDYLLGVLVVEGESQRFYGFLAETPEQEGEVWRAFLALMAQYPTAPIFHFSEYEAETLKRLAKLYPVPGLDLRRLLGRCYDLHHMVTAQVICPVENYSLKSLANWLGFQWRDSAASGDQSVCWYDQWSQTRNYSYLERIVQYNEDDCRATWRLKQWLASFLSSQGT